MFLITHLIYEPVRTPINENNNNRTFTNNIEFLPTSVFRDSNANAMGSAQKAKSLV